MSCSGPADVLGLVTSPPSAKVFEIWLPGHPPGANQLTRMNRWSTGAERAKWKEMTYIACREAQGLDRTSWSPVILEFHPVYDRRRRRDIDNLIASYKPVIDGLVTAGVIPDDDVSTVTGIWVRPRVTKEHPPGVLVRVHEATDSTRNTP